jgi:DNA-binding NarL/FixJ family response regulator
MTENAVRTGNMHAADIGPSAEHNDLLRSRTKATDTIPDRVDETEAGSSGLLSNIMTREKRQSAEAPPGRPFLEGASPAAEAPPVEPAGNSDGRVRIVIADDHLLMAQGLAKLLEGDFHVVAAVNSGRELLAAAREHDANLALIDVSMPEMTGMEATRKLRHSLPGCKVILVSMHGKPEFVREAFGVGAAGYLLKSSAGSELRDAIREVMNGNVYVSSSIAKDVLASLLAPPAAALSPREREILALVAEGCSAKEIASCLGIAVKTAQFHRTNLMTKLRVHTTAELTKYALGHGIVSY